MAVENILRTAKTALIESPMRLKLFARKRGATETRNEQATFEALIEGCWDALWRYAYHTTGNAEEAEDLLSETLLEGFRNFGQFRGDTVFVRWMYRVMTTTRIDMTRRAARRKTESLDAMLERPLGNEAALADKDANPEAIIVGPMLSEPVQQALAGLSEEYRAVVVLADMEQMDYADVSRILQIPVGTVRSRLHRARANLRQSLAAYVEEQW